jgi:hypothetical protein
MEEQLPWVVLPNISINIYVLKCQNCVRRRGCLFWSYPQTSSCRKPSKHTPKGSHCAEARCNYVHSKNLRQGEFENSPVGQLLRPCQRCRHSSPQSSRSSQDHDPELRYGVREHTDQNSGPGTFELLAREGERKAYLHALLCMTASHIRAAKCLAICPRRTWKIRTF